jgi:predicted phosphodiesterase
VVCGHSHKPQVVRKPSGVLVVNPGSAGPRRFKLPVTCAELMISGENDFLAQVAHLL